MVFRFPSPKIFCIKFIQKIDVTNSVDNISAVQFRQICVPVRGPNGTGHYFIQAVCEPECRLKRAELEVLKTSQLEPEKFLGKRLVVVREDEKQSIPSSSESFSWKSSIQVGLCSILQTFRKNLYNFKHQFYFKHIFVSKNWKRLLVCCFQCKKPTWSRQWSRKPNKIQFLLFCKWFFNPSFYKVRRHVLHELLHLCNCLECVGPLYPIRCTFHSLLLCKATQSKKSYVHDILRLRLDTDYCRVSYKCNWIQFPLLNQKCIWLQLQIQPVKCIQLLGYLVTSSKKELITRVNT